MNRLHATLCRVLFLVIFKNSCGEYVSLTDITNPEFYDTMERPPFENRKGQNAPVKVTIAVRVEQVKHIIEGDENYFSMTVLVSEEWTDRRLVYPDSSNNSYISVSKENAIWSPDLLLINERCFSNYEQLIYPEIYPNGSVFNRKRIYIKALPVGRDPKTSAISIRIMSLNYTKEDLTLAWHKESPIEIAPDIHLGSYLSDMLKAEDVEIGSCNSKGIAFLVTPKHGNYSCLYLNIVKEIATSSSMLVIYIPSTLCVIMSWSAFWMDNGSLLGRSLVTMVALIHLLTQKVSITSELLAVNHPYVFNTWLHCCIAFVVTALFQVVAVSYIYGRSSDRYTRNWGIKESPAVRKLHERGDDRESIEESQHHESIRPCFRIGLLESCFPRIPSPSNADAINAISRWAFPLAFTICATVFGYFQYPTTRF